MVKVKEIFTSIQGESPLVGYKQLFVRLCGCNLSCKYCDTDYSTANAKEYSTDEIVNICKNNTDCHSVSFTGGEPLLQIEFLKDFLPKSPLPVFLETNSILYTNLEQIIDYVTYVSADIKLPSATGMKNNWDIHDKFFNVASGKNLFAKVVFDENITDNEINNVVALVSKYNIELILQPVMVENKLGISSDNMLKIFDKFVEKYKKTRLIPQVHKFINVV